jgi:hypothetical protein
MRPVADRRRGRAVLAGILAIVPLTPLLGAPPAGAEPGEPRHVVVVSIPGLGFDDLGPGATPHLYRLAGRGAVAALSVRSIGRTTERAEGYATLSAGARATAPGGPGSSGFGPGEALPSGREVPFVRDQSVLGAARVVVADLGAVQEANEGLHQGAVVGALGDALGGAGWSTAVVANHDGPEVRDRVAALGLVDTRGQVTAGQVGPELVQVLPDGRRGTRLMDGLLPRNLSRTPPGAFPSSSNPRVVDRAALLIELGDVNWARHRSAADRRLAVRRADRLLGRALRLSATDLTKDLVIVVAPTAPGPRDEPTPFVMAGYGVDRGMARSGTTRKAGYVTLVDVAPTILERAGIEVPDSMSGTPIEVDRTGAAGGNRIAALRAAVDESRFVDRSSGIFKTTLPIVFAAWSLLLLAVVVAPLGRAGPFASALVRWMGLVIAAVPTVTFLVAGIATRSWGQPAWSAVVWVGAVAAGSVAAAWRRPGGAAVALAAAAWLVQVVDVVTGGRLQFDSILGNSPTVAGRFAGMGNIAFALLTASTIVLAVALVGWLGRGGADPEGDLDETVRLGEDRPGPDKVNHPRPRVDEAGGAPPASLLVAAALFAVALVVDGWPSWGSDVGGVLVLGPVAAVTLWTLAGRRLSWAKVAVTGIATAVVLGGLALVDRARPEGQRTHLGRLADTVLSGGGAGDVVHRKADAAIASFGRSSLVWHVISVVGLVVLVGLLRPATREAARRLARRPPARAFVVGGVVAAVLGGALNDSGVMVPAMMATVLLPFAVHVLVRPGSPLGPRRSLGDR